MRNAVLAAIAAWVFAFPSVASAQPRGDGQGRPRPQYQQQQQDLRRGGGFSGMLREIAGARLDRAHAAQRSDRPPPQQPPQNGNRRRW